MNFVYQKRKTCPGATPIPREEGLEESCSLPSASTPAPAGSVIFLYTLKFSPLWFHALWGVLHVISTRVRVVSAVPRSGSAQLLGLHCFSEQYRGSELSAIPKVVLSYACTVNSFAVNLDLGSWYKWGEGLKADKHLLFYTNRCVCVHWKNLSFVLEMEKRSKVRDFHPWKRYKNELRNKNVINRKTTL